MRAAVLGRPVEHSLSPVLHRAAYRALGLDWTYDALDCGRDDLARVLAAADGDVAGFSCTMPLKRVALELASQAGGRARSAGAANTLLPQPDRGWRAENTDVAGVLAALAEGRIAPQSVAILGAGGTAQAVVVALSELGLDACTALVRSPRSCSDLLATAARVGVAVTVVPLDDPAPLAAADLVVSTLPPGAADRFAAAPWRSDQAVLDVVYHPWPSSLAAAVAAAGGRVVGGAAMLLHQAAAQVALMTGRPAPLEAMRAALDENAWSAAR